MPLPKRIVRLTLCLAALVPALLACTSHSLVAPVPAGVLPPTAIPRTLAEVAPPLPVCRGAPSPMRHEETPWPSPPCGGRSSQHCCATCG